MTDRWLAVGFLAVTYAGLVLSFRFSHGSWGLLPITVICLGAFILVTSRPEKQLK